MRFLQFLKMNWMVFWRIMLILQWDRAIAPSIYWIYWTTLIVTFIMAFFLNVKICAFPLGRLLILRSPIARIKYDKWSIIDGGRSDWQQNYGMATRSSNQHRLKRTIGSKGSKNSIRKYNQNACVKSASRPGWMSGFEPKSLPELTKPQSNIMFGSPGQGLNTAIGMSKRNAQLGIKGEENFAKILTKTGLINSFPTAWSVTMPDESGFIPHRTLNTDVDCLLATNDTLYLLDLKYYKSGDVEYQAQGNELHCIDRATGKYVGDKPKLMSQNMKIATELYRKHLPNVRIKPLVLFIPTEKGVGTISNSVRWPGFIEAMNVHDFITQLSNEPLPSASSRSYDGLMRAKALISK